MQFAAKEVDGSTTRLVLEGRLDAPGTETIETGFTATVSGAGRHILLDLSKVSFVGSLGIRLLLANARVVQRRGRKMVLFGAQPQAQEVFETVSLDALVPIVATEAEALALLAD